MKSLHHRLCTVIILVITVFSLMAVSVHGAEANPSWHTQWGINLEKLAGQPIYTPAFPQMSADGTAYINLTPKGKGNNYVDYIAITSSGKVKWIYRASTDKREYFNGRDFEIDASGNLYLYYFFEDSGLTIHKIGPNGKLLNKYTLPDAKEKKYGQLLQHQDDGTVRLAQTYKNGGVKLFSLTKEGKVFWSKKVKTNYVQGWADLMSRVEFVGDNFYVHQAKTVEVFDKKGNKLFQLTKPDNEQLSLSATKDGLFIGTATIIDSKQGNKTIRKRLVSFDRSGKQLWSIKLTNGSLLYQMKNTFFYTVTDDANWITELISIDPANGKSISTYTPKKYLLINNENYSNHLRDYSNDSFIDITQFSGYGGKEPQRTLLEPSTFKEMHIVFEAVYSETNHIRASMNELYQQQNGDTHALLWNAYEFRMMVLDSGGDVLDSNHSSAISH